MSNLESQLSEKQMIGLRLLERLGIPLILLAAVGWAIYQGVSWGGTHVLQPMMAAHIKNLDTVQDALKQQTTTMSAYADSISKIEKGEEERHRLLAEILKEQQRTTIAIESLTKVKP